mmetsp:Transcript_89552/g.258280  ORF Transcript_89552/g.258280 Transcript_89552/m.258280 type:complete len:201 (+) Transcript_89552:1069-1671(+)
MHHTCYVAHSDTGQHVLKHRLERRFRQHGKAPQAGEEPHAALLHDNVRQALPDVVSVEPDQIRRCRKRLKDRNLPGHRALSLLVEIVAVQILRTQVENLDGCITTAGGPSSGIDAPERPRPKELAELELLMEFRRRCKPHDLLDLIDLLELERRRRRNYLALQRLLASHGKAEFLRRGESARLIFSGDRGDSLPTNLQQS